MAQIAHDRLTAPQRGAFTTMLREHPRFAADFLEYMPAAVANGSKDQQTQWLFRQAGPWPDMARRYGWWLRYRYHAPQWHFINHPIGDPQIGAEPEETLPQGSGGRGRPNKKMNAVQALRANVAIAQDSEKPAAQRALALTWICHIVADLHQPLHATSFYTSKRFRKGDRGGNLIPVAGQGNLNNLHALWDSLAGRGFSDRMQMSRARQLVLRFPRSTLPAAGVTDARIWARESVAISRQLAYDATVRDHIAAYDDAAGVLPPLSVSADYVDQARAATEPRIALAGYRLAAILAEVLSPAAK